MASPDPSVSPVAPFVTAIKKIVKKNGITADFSIEKFYEGIVKALHSANIDDKNLAIELTKKALTKLEQQFKDSLISAEDAASIIERTLMEEAQIKAAKAYILYRHKKHEERQRRAFIVGHKDIEENLLFTDQALKVLERRYLLKDKDGSVIETPKQMLQRVAKNIASADRYYKSSKEDIEKTTKEFYEMMAALQFLPNSPTLMNAGTKVQQLSACFVLPIEDTMQGIFGSLKDAALIHQRGSGTGFSFSRLRPKGDSVKDNMGVASGSVDFLRVYDSALEAIKQGGVRKGANMAVLRVDHPDIIRFIEAKRDKQSLKNFNISVGITDRFMKAVEADKDYYLTNPRTGKHVGKLRARDVFSIITQNAWKTGDPGLVFIDEINRKHPAKNLGDIETTNQCGEAPLLPYEGCVLGSINLNKFVNQEKKEVKWDDLAKTIITAVHFLDNTIDMNTYPKKIIEETTKMTRKFGLGLMGFADLLATLRIKYDSEQGLEMADQVMSFIRQKAYDASEQLAAKRGACPAWPGSDHEKTGKKMRNMTCLSISPTGTISILADASPGCEPFFAISYQRSIYGSDSDLVYMNKEFEKVAKERGIYTPELMRKVSRSGNIQMWKDIPRDIRDIFVTSQDIKPEWHIKMMATLQKHIDNSISKTINFPSTASIKDIEEAYILAWKAKCKGITIYRDGSYEDQVINIGEG
ncbi:MAG TPA: adenosylcobalamin-dependent ribonucleoside-diphosphate reductase [Candidatus Nanoarchaeia archaeon]|nr:adenosylcobalamin-dependent ribonucleoside-diphosphate reductase [Candidatus Nanoarchaeia archaeon]